MTGLVLDRLVFVCAGQILPVTPAGVEKLIYSCRGCMTHKSGGLNIAWLMIILIILHKLVKDRYLCMNVFLINIWCLKTIFVSSLEICMLKT